MFCEGYYTNSGCYSMTNECVILGTRSKLASLSKLREDHRRLIWCYLTFGR
jgi:hypothetical protein